VDVDLPSGNGLLAVADDDVLDLELCGRRFVRRDLDLGLLVGCHGGIVDRRRQGFAEASPGAVGT
jgi:hypothetical protein